MAQIYERNVGAEDGLRDKEAYRDQSITKSRVRAWLYMGVNHPPGRVAESLQKWNDFWNIAPHDSYAITPIVILVLFSSNEPIKFSKSSAIDFTGETRPIKHYLRVGRSVKRRLIRAARFGDRLYNVDIRGKLVKLQLRVVAALGNSPAISLWERLVNLVRYSLFLSMLCHIS